MRSVLVIGAPRSGTTWVARVLSAGAGAAYLEEPDNHFRFASAARAKRLSKRGPYPVLVRGEQGPELSAFGALWEAAFSRGTSPGWEAAPRTIANRLVQKAGVRRVVDGLRVDGSSAVMLRFAEQIAQPERAAVSDEQHLVVKSVLAPFAVEWIAARHNPAVLVVQREPIRMASSWLALGWLDPKGAPPLAGVPTVDINLFASRHGAPPTSQLGQAAWLSGAMVAALADAAKRNPDWQEVKHADLHGDAAAQFPRLATALGLPWSDAGAQLLAATDRPGGGYEIARPSASLDSDWRRRLDPDQQSEVEQVLRKMDLPAWAMPTG